MVVLADNIWADRVIGFIGDVGVDPLAYISGFTGIVRNLGGKKMRLIASDLARQVLILKILMGSLLVNALKRR